MAVMLVWWAVIARRLAPMANTSRDHFDAIMVLGTPADDDGNPTPEQLARVTEAVREYERGVAPRLLFTGGPADNRFVEADVMARAGGGAGDSAIGDFRGDKGDGHDSECVLFRSGLMSARMAFGGGGFERVPSAAGEHDFQPHSAGVADACSAAVAAGRGGIRIRSLEILKTIRYLLYASWAERCEP